MISGIELGAFKAFNAESLELRPLTVLVGENNFWQVEHPSCHQNYGSNRTAPRSIGPSAA